MLCAASRTAAQHAPPATTSKGKTMHPGTIHRLVWGALWISALAGGMAHAQLTAIVAVEPTEKKAGNSILRSALEAGLSKASGQTVTVTTTEDLADAMRATRSGGYDIFIGPPQVAASALQRGYELVGCSQKSDHYVLVGLPQIESVGAPQGQAPVPAAAGLGLQLHGARHAERGRPVVQRPQERAPRKIPAGRAECAHPGHRRRDRGAGGRMGPSGQPPSPARPRCWPPRAQCPAASAPWCARNCPARCAASFRSGSAPHPAAQAWHPRACGPTCRNTRKWRNSGCSPPPACRA